MKVWCVIGFHVGATIQRDEDFAFSDSDRQFESSLDISYLDLLVINERITDMEEMVRTTGVNQGINRFFFCTFCDGAAKFYLSHKSVWTISHIA